MDTNLLVNGSFETNWSDGGTHTCLVIPKSTPAFLSERGNVFSPPGWVTWFRHVPDRWDQPEVHDVHGDPVRIRTGTRAMLLFTFYRRHDGGFYQQVGVNPGAQLTLTAWAHAWSNHTIKHEDNPQWSEGAGKSVVAWAEGSQPVTGDPQQDARSNFTFWAGIDPTGGTDPLSAVVEWSPGWHVYNGYCQQLALGDVTAVGDTVTVFLRSRTMWKFKHNDAYWDDVELTATGGTVPVRGTPRVQFERTYLLLPPGLSAEWWQAAAAIAREHNWTMGGSADDAGMGDLDVRKVLAVNPEGWDGGDAQ